MVKPAQDRLIAAAAWNEPQSLEQALLVAEYQRNKIDWKALDQFVIREGLRDEKEVGEFYRRLDRPLPDDPGRGEREIFLEIGRGEKMERQLRCLACVVCRPATPVSVRTSGPCLPKALRRL